MGLPGSQGGKQQAVAGEWAGLLPGQGSEGRATGARCSHRAGVKQLMVQCTGRGLWQLLRLPAAQRSRRAAAE